jgi:hypothetical protein
MSVTATAADVNEKPRDGLSTRFTKDQLKQFPAISATSMRKPRATAMTLRRYARSSVCASRTSMNAPSRRRL